MIFRSAAGTSTARCSDSRTPIICSMGRVKANVVANATEGAPVACAAARPQQAEASKTTTSAPWAASASCGLSSDARAVIVLTYAPTDIAGYGLQAMSHDEP